MGGKPGAPPLPPLPEVLRRRAMEHLHRLTETLDESPLLDLTSKYRECVEVLSSLPRILSDKLSDHFNLSRDAFLEQFHEDLSHMMRRGEIRELSEWEVKLLSQAVSDAMSAMFTSLIDLASQVLADQVPARDADPATRIRDQVAELLAEIAVAKAERDQCREELEDLMRGIQLTGRYRVLGILEESGPLKAVEIAARLGLSEVMVRRYLKGLEEEGLVVVDRTKKPYKYRVREGWRALLGRIHREQRRAHKKAVEDGQK